MMKKLLIVLFCCLPLISKAQTDEFRRAYEDFKKEAQKDYDDFRRKANEEYAEWVKKAWREYKTLPAIPLPKEEQTPPVVIKEEDKEKPIEDRSVVIEEEINIPEPEPQPNPLAPIWEKPQPTEKYLAFSLYGTEMKVRADERLKFTLSNIREESIAAAWERLSSEDYNNLIRDCLLLRIDHKLCDWAYLRLLDVMTQEFLGKGTNEAELLKAFIYCQTGYQMRLAYVEEKIYMLYASKYYLFNKPCWKIDDVFYYSDNITAERISICEASFPNEQAMSMAVNEEQLLTQRPTNLRTLKSEDVEWMKATVAEDENLMLFCDEYPSSYFGEDFMTRWALYANAPLDSKVKENLYPQLWEWIKEKDAAEAVNILCHWVQTAFVYELDNKLWGGDRAFFADETLYYPYCDCEDRSILLTRLVRDLLGLKCALVYYPGHLATAIAVGEDVKGDYFRIDGRKYLVCDPTYIGAPIGVTMEGMENETAKVIVLE